MLRHPSLILLGTLLTACGGTSGELNTGNSGSAGNGEGAISINVVENLQQAYNFDFNQDQNGNPVKYAVTGGADAALLSAGGLNGSTISFNDAPDFENPSDANQDNVYELEVTGTLLGRSAAQLITIKVTDAGVISAGVTGALNDTGITLCGDFAPTATDNNDVDCISGGATDPDGGTPSPQDAHVGRDHTSLTANLDKIGEGQAGFDFTKLNEQAEALPSGASSWACVKDNVTGLIWQARQDADLQNDTEAAAYVVSTNAAALCGSDQWRLPSHSELLSLIDYSVNTAPLTSSQFFADAQLDAAYRSSPPSSGTQVWAVSFNDASLSSQSKSNDLAIRLVRGE